MSLRAYPRMRDDRSRRRRAGVPVQGDNVSGAKTSAFFGTRFGTNASRRVHKKNNARTGLNPGDLGTVEMDWITACSVGGRESPHFLHGVQSGRRRG
jgi:hypothetical protein